MYSLLGRYRTRTLLAVWFGQTVGEDPVVELVLPDRVYRWDGYHGPVYYH